ncbi:hypothetical protein ABTX87_53690, partial [Streptomyces sp. NPDC097610]
MTRPDEVSGKGTDPGSSSGLGQASSRSPSPCSTDSIGSTASPAPFPGPARPPRAGHAARLVHLPLHRVQPKR